MKYKAIITDIDGTLTQIGPEKLPSPKVVDAIKKAIQKGVIFAMATARPLVYMETFLKNVDIDGYIILDNGAAIYNIREKSYMWESFLPNDVAGKIFEIAKKNEKKEGIAFSTKEGRVFNPQKVLPSMHIRRINVKALSYEEADHYIEEINSLEEHIVAIKTSSFANHNLLDTFVTNAEATKQHAVLKLADILKISTHEIIGIGDHYNDFPLLMACGLKVAMGNAVPELKAIADYVAPSLENDGVVDVINRFVLS